RQALGGTARRADRRRSRAAGFRGGAVLRPHRARRRAEGDRREAEYHAAQDPRRRRIQEAADFRRQRSDAEHVGRIRREHQARRRQVGGAGEEARPDAGVVISPSLRAQRSNPESEHPTLDCFVAELVIGPATSGRTRWLLAMTTWRRARYAA